MFNFMSLFSLITVDSIFILILQVEKFISQTIDSDVEIYCDASNKLWTIPPDIVAIADRPYTRFSHSKKLKAKM